MAKKKGSVQSKIKSVYDKHKEQILAYFMDFLETGGRSLLDWLKHVAEIKEKIRKIVLSTGLVIAGLFILILGLANYLATLVPNWPAGLMQIVVGAAAILLAVIYVKV